MQTDTHVYFGDAVKAIEGKENTVGGYLVRFTSPDDPDLVNDFFTKSTEFGTNTTPPVLYHHGLDSALKTRILGKGEWKIDDVGVWVETQLSMRDEYERQVMEMARAGKLGWSSGAVGHAVEREAVGKAFHIKTWIIGEASLTPTPAEYRNTVVPLKALLPKDEAEQAATVAAESEEQSEQTQNNTKMSDTNTTPVDVEAIAAKAAESAAIAAAEATMKAFEARLEAKEAEEIKRRDAKSVEPDRSAPAVHMDSSSKKFDNYSLEDLCLTSEVLNNTTRNGASTEMRKAIARRLEGSEGQTETMRHAQSELKSFLGRHGVKANEIHQSTLSTGGDEWIGVAYSSDLWNVVRQETAFANLIPSFEFPAGAESLVIPLESTDPTWYKVAQSSALSSNPGGIPTNTVTSSKLTTANQTMTLSKMGARALWTGELSEDAVLPFANQLRAQLAVSGAEYFESALIDGDTETGGTANINDIAGTPAATDYFLCFDGPRKLALVTNTANSRDGGVLTAEDFLETARLMGTNGRNAIDKSKVKFIVDNSTHYKMLQLPEVKTRDVNTAATVESGNVTRIYGYDVMVSGHMCKAGSGLSNTAGKIDVDTASNNTKGQILAVRPDQWRLGYRRRMTMETTRVPAADATEIVVIMRAGFQYRDTEAAAITYNLTV